MMYLSNGCRNSRNMSVIVTRGWQLCISLILELGALSDILGGRWITLFNRFVPFYLSSKRTTATVRGGFFNSGQVRS